MAKEESKFTLILLANYQSGLSSMHLFAELLKRLLVERGVAVVLLRPNKFFGFFCTRSRGLNKWFGYLDQYVLFPFILYWKLGKFNKENTVVHILDHSNAPYYFVTTKFKTIVTCHDLLAVSAALGEVEGVRISSSGRLQQKLILNSLRRVPYIVCVSSATFDEVKRLTLHNEVNAKLIYSALNYPYSNRIEKSEKGICEILPWLKSEARFILHVGGNQWYKNRKGVLLTFSEMIRQNCCEENLFLVFVGQPPSDDLISMVFEYRLQHRVKFLSNVTSAEMNLLYTSCEFLLFPSYREGFGWPIVEAQASGCLVVTTDQDPMREIAGNGAIYIEKISGLTSEIVSEWGKLAAVRISQILKISEAEKMQYINSGFANLKRFGEKEMLEGYLSAYSKLFHPIRSQFDNFFNIF